VQQHLNNNHVNEFVYVIIDVRNPRSVAN
jgi:hypothetical protein